MIPWGCAKNPNFGGVCVSAAVLFFLVNPQEEHFTH
jgi:hypothetical protein